MVALFVFGLCEIQSATSAPDREAVRASVEARKEALRAKFQAKKNRILERFGKQPHSPPDGPPPPNNTGDIPNWQPVECIRSGNPGDADASFISANGSFPLLIQFSGVSSDVAGAKINLPPNTPAGTIAFDVVNVGAGGTLDTDIFLAVRAGPTGSLFRYIAPEGQGNANNTALVGNRATVDLQTLRNGVIGPTIPAELYLQVDADQDGIARSITIDNLAINGQPIENKFLQVLQCPVGF